MNRKMIVVEGYLASGKSTFALALAKALQAPCFIKDTFKTALCRSVTVADRTESRLFSAVTFDAMLYAAERVLEAGVPVILEGNFVPPGVKKTDEAGAIRNLLEKYGCAVLDFKFAGDTRVLHKRFLEREKTAERGEANKIGTEVPFGDFDRWCRNLEGFDAGGETVRVDTTDFARVDFAACIRRAQEFLKNPDTQG